MKNKTTIILFSSAFILVLTMALDNANLLHDFTEKGLWITRKYLMDGLYLAIAILSWHWLKKTGNGFFKWLLVMTVLYFAQSIEGAAFKKLFVWIAHDYHHPNSTLLLIATSINSALRITLNLLIALLPIFAVYNYGAKTKFLKAFQPKLLLMLILFWVFSIVHISIMQAQQVSNWGIAGLIFIVANSGVSILIDLYGIRASLNKFKQYPNQLFKWLITFFGAGAAHQLIALTHNILFIQAGEVSKAGYLNLTMVFHYVGPLLLIAALLTYREYEGVSYEYKK